MKKLFLILAFFTMPALTHGASNRYVVTTTTSSISMDLLASVTASSNSSVDFTGLAGNKYTQFILYADRVYPVLANVYPQLQVATGGAFIASGYRWQSVTISSFTSSISGNASDTVFILSGTETIGTVAANQLSSYEIHLHGVDGETALKRVNFWSTGLWSSGFYKSIYGGGEVDTGSLYITGVRFSMSSSVYVASGTFRLYGIRNSQN